MAQVKGQKRHAQTQCNFYLMNKPKVKHQSTNCEPPRKKTRCIGFQATATEYTAVQVARNFLAQKLRSKLTTTTTAQPKQALSPQSVNTCELCGRPWELNSTDTPDWAPTGNLGHNQAKPATNASEGPLNDVKSVPRPAEKQFQGQPSSISSTQRGDACPAQNLIQSDVQAKPKSDHPQQKQLCSKLIVKASPNSEKSLPFTDVMPETKDPALPVDLGLVKVEPPDPVPTGLFTSILKVNQPANQLDKAAPRFSDKILKLAQFSSPSCGSFSKTSDSSVPLDKSCQTRVTMERFSELESALASLEARFRRACRDLSNLHRRLLDTDLSEKALVNDSQKVLFFTGFADFKSLKTIESFLKISHVNGITKSQGFLLTLMILRLNISFADLGQRFNVAEILVSEIFEKWQRVVDENQQSILPWPAREKLRLSMPENFRNFFGRQIAMIIDGFEVFVQGPLVLSEASKVSPRGLKKTLKFLLGITPAGVVTFVSEALPADNTYKILIENCNILMYMLPGDVILVNSNIWAAGKSEPFYCAEITTKPATCEPILTELDENRRYCLTDLWVKVEEVTGRLKKSYEILKGTMGWSAARTVRVCAALSNLTNSGKALEES